MIREVNACRLCRAPTLISVLSLGQQALTGIFPKSKSDVVPSAPLNLVKCTICGLVQLKHSYDAVQLYGANYGYRSGLNQAMVQHLKKTAQMLLEIVELKKNDNILDIGSNDGTLLGFFPENLSTLIGFDPAGEKFKKYYRKDVNLVTEFFSKNLFDDRFGKSKAKIVTSISMFYDLEDPLDFAQQVYSILADDGVWHLEQSYLPSMLKVNAYDTICHEHLEYYALKQIKWMLDRVGFKIIKLTKNNINGGSFAVTVAKNSAPYIEATQAIENMLAEEDELGLDNLETYKAFELRITKQKDSLTNLLCELKADNKKVYGYGASTKGNVILQHVKIDELLLPVIAEVNADKFNHYTPGSYIPIMSEEIVHAMMPDYLLVLPWHFKENILAREKNYTQKGGKFIFPLPQVEIV